VYQTRFAVCHRPRSRVGGDFYDVFRLDEEHVAFYVLDAMGRGAPTSSLMTLYVKKSVQAKEIVGRAYRLVPPEEVLVRLNREVVSLSLPEPPFVTMVYGQLNCRDGRVAFARAAHPPPLYVPHDGEPAFWRPTGSFLGVFGAEFVPQEKQLRPGDRLLVYTDGANLDESETDGNRLIDSVKHYRSLPLAALVDRVSRDVLERTRQPDDFTLLGVEYATP
jgi:sigma-B regulation protein RsbU (phosphoserine phosphatase)